MNKKFIIIFAFILVFFLGAIFLGQSSYFISSIMDKTESSFFDSKKNMGLLIAENVRKNLVVGDLNGAFRSLMIYKSKGYIDNFEIVKNKKIISSSNFLNFKEKIILSIIFSVKTESNGLNLGSKKKYPATLAFPEG